MLRDNDPESTRPPKEAAATKEEIGCLPPPPAASEVKPAEVEGQQSFEHLDSNSWSGPFRSRRTVVSPLHGGPPQVYGGRPKKPKGKLVSHLKSLLTFRGHSTHGASAPSKHGAGPWGAESINSHGKQAATGNVDRGASAVSSSGGGGTPSSIHPLEVSTTSTAAPAAASTTAAAGGDIPCIHVSAGEQPQRQHRGSSSSPAFLRGGSGNARRVAWRYKQYVRKRLRRLQQRRPKKQQQNQKLTPAGIPSITTSVFPFAFKDRRAPTAELSRQCSDSDEEDSRSESDCSYTPFRYSRVDIEGWEGTPLGTSPALAYHEPLRGGCSSEKVDPRKDARGSVTDCVGLAPAPEKAAGKDSTEAGVCCVWPEGQPDVETPRESEVIPWEDCGGGALALEIRMLNAIEQVNYIGQIK